jgi:hypothetical protein
MQYPVYCSYIIFSAFLKRKPLNKKAALCRIMVEESKDVAGYEMPDRPEEYKPAGNILELLDRILDKGVVIVGDIRISVADIELLKVQIRLLIASVDKAKELGIDFSWAKMIEQPQSKTELENKLKELESKLKEQPKK